MYKLMTLAVVLVGLALAPVLGGMSGKETPRELADVSQQAAASVAVERTEVAQTCDWACEACEPDQGCQQVCTEVGDCGSTCGVTARCDAQHVWSDDACACVSR